MEQFAFLLIALCACVPGAYLQDVDGAPAAVPDVSGSVSSPDDYQWGAWGVFGTCSVSCGPGIRQRQRACFFYRVVGSGIGAGSRAPGVSALTNQCPGNNIGEESCNVRECPACLGPWSGYDTCTVTCGTGTQTRRRSCRCSSAECFGPLEESIPCVLTPCYGTVGVWSDWTVCSQVCGAGTQTRNRFCIGGECAPNVQTTQQRSCNLGICGWGAWGSWSQCNIAICEQRRERQCPSQTCTSGHFIRLRSCRPRTGCLVDPSIPIPQPRAPVPSVNVCRTDSLRVPCGPPGIGKEDCENAGCCFDDFVIGLDFCYQPSLEGPTDPRN